MTRAVLDTSVLVRHFTGDDPRKAAAAKKLLEEAPDNSLIFPDVALAELGFVLLRIYRMSRAFVAGVLRSVVTHPAIDIQPIVWLAVADDLEAGHGLVDAYLMRTAAAVGVPTLLTFDTKAKPARGVQCREP